MFNDCTISTFWIRQVLFLSQIGFLHVSLRFFQLQIWHICSILNTGRSVRKEHYCGCAWCFTESENPKGPRTFPDICLPGPRDLGINTTPVATVTSPCQHPASPYIDMPDGQASELTD